MTSAHYGNVLRRRWPTIAVVTLVALAGAWATTLLMTPKYEAGTELFVSIQGPDTAGDLLQGSSFIQQRVQSYADVVTSEVVLSPVIDALDLRTTPSTLAERIDVVAPLDRVLINITVTDTDAERAAAIADEVSSSFIEQVARLEEQSATGSSPVLISTLQSADVPLDPVSPRTSLNLALGLLVGLVLGCGAAALRDHRGVEGATSNGQRQIDPDDGTQARRSRHTSA